jgi:hypothetical protein
LWLDLLF